MAEAEEITQWIQRLADADPSVRADFARRLHEAGHALYCEALNRWCTDPEFKELVSPVRHGFSDADPEPAETVVGIAVTPEHFERIRSANGSVPLASVPPDQDAKEFELHFEGNLNFDVLTTREPGGSGAIARYLERFGEGIQQIEIFVLDVDRATEILCQRFGIAPIYPATRAGADGTRVNFFLVSVPQGGKVLLELVESAHRSKD